MGVTPAFAVCRLGAIHLALYLNMLTMVHFVAELVPNLQSAVVVSQRGYEFANYVPVYSTASHHPVSCTRMQAGTHTWLGRQGIAPESWPIQDGHWEDGSYHKAVQAL